MAASYTRSQSFTSAHVNPKKPSVSPTYSRSPAQLMVILDISAVNVVKASGETLRLDPAAYFPRVPRAR